MEQIVLKSAGGYTSIEVDKKVYRRGVDGSSLDITVKPSTSKEKFAGVYNVKDVTEFIQQMAELLGLPSVRDMSNEEPYTLPAELVDKLDWELKKDHPDSDQFIWEACTEDSDTVIGNWVQQTDNAIEQLWNIFQGHPYEAKEYYVLVDSDYDFLRSYSITSDDPVVTAEVSMYRTNAIQFTSKEDAEAVQRLLKDCRFNIERY